MSTEACGTSTITDVVLWSCKQHKWFSIHLRCIWVAAEPRWMKLQISSWHLRRDCYHKNKAIRMFCYLNTLPLHNRLLNFGWRAQGAELHWPPASSLSLLLKPQDINSPVNHSMIVRFATYRNFFKKCKLREINIIIIRKCLKSDNTAWSRTLVKEKDI